MSRREYKVNLTINFKKIDKVIIDPHYEEKHRHSINDGIILELVLLLDNMEYEPETVSNTGFEYYTTDDLFYELKPYKLIWLLEQHEQYIGVVNAYRKGAK